MSNNFLYSIILAGCAGVIVGEAYKAGVRDGRDGRATPVSIFTVSSDLPGDDNGEVPTSSPESNGESEE